MMKWEKLGLTYNVGNIPPYLVTHASNPLAIHLQEDVFRVFFSGRDLNNKSSVGYVDVDISTNTTISEPTFSFSYSSNENSFFSHGISIGNCYKSNNKEFILFMGWQLRGNEHWRGDIGQLELKNNKELSLASSSPFMTTDSEDQVSLSYPWVLSDNKNQYRMWYGSTIDWNSPNGEMVHVIKYATSLDGLTWNKHGVAIPWELGHAQAFSRPCVIEDRDGLHMWYSYRSGTGEKYRIGYSFSEDGVSWSRPACSGLTPSESDWDSTMVCYPFVFDHKGRRYMLYNGSDFGKNGFGLAKLIGNINL